MGVSSSKKKIVQSSNRSDTAAEIYKPRTIWASESTGTERESSDEFSQTSSSTSSPDCNDADTGETKVKRSSSLPEQSGTPVVAFSLNKKNHKQSSEDIGTVDKKGDGTQTVSRDYPVSEAEKMLHLYKKERTSNHMSANMNNKDKTKHKPKPQYKTSNFYEVQSRRLCTPSQIESDMVVHPSTSYEKVNEGENKTIKMDPDRVSNTDVAEEKPMTDTVLETNPEGKKVIGLTRNVLEERSDYLTRAIILKPVSSGKFGSERLKLFQELAGQGVILPEQWSELNHKQEEAMRELVSTGLLAQKEETKYSMSIGAPIRRPPPRLNQIPPIEKTKVDITDFFSTKIPDIVTDSANKRGQEAHSEAHVPKTNIIVVSEADDTQKTVNVENKKDVKYNGELHTGARSKQKDTTPKIRRKYIISGIGDDAERAVNSMKQSPEKHAGKTFIAKAITVEKDRPCVTFASETSIINPSDSGTSSQGPTQEESEYFDAMNGGRYTDSQRRKLRLWDVDMM